MTHPTSSHRPHRRRDRPSWAGFTCCTLPDVLDECQIIIRAASRRLFRLPHIPYVMTHPTSPHRRRDRPSWARQIIIRAASRRAAVLTATHTLCYDAPDKHASAVVG
ncbi:hypothetical protein FA95DRAFT_64928 [Auriscalpium vulgare]|uniref:Uncharacterized protein n=1 Tax=Auriscalpium vulgare TaxID=40419 RepID=A0ACB8S8H8_9AGAM|nr:hypothetical protein FA95DRAFT_64928 [Auriscalpium vulgare]